MSKKNVTFNDIAKYTGFSKTTISRFFNQPDSLTPQNQKIIADALSDLNYKENKVAKILANGCTEFVGLIIPNLKMSYYAEMLNQILATCETHDYKFLVYTSHGDAEAERRYINELLAYKIEGLIELSHTIPSAELAKYPVPVVTIEREDTAISSVNTDNYIGALKAMTLLYEHGCDIMIHFNTPTDPLTPAYSRKKGFDDFCQTHCLTHEFFILETETDYFSLKKSLLNALEKIETTYIHHKIGIFMSNDTYANALLNIIFMKYGDLPKNIYLVGFDNSPISEEAILPISTVGQQIQLQAQTAVKMLIEQIDQIKTIGHLTASEPVHKMISPVLIKRETTEK